MNSPKIISEGSFGFMGFLGFFGSLMKMIIPNNHRHGKRFVVRWLKMTYRTNDIEKPKITGPISLIEKLMATIKINLQYFIKGFFIFVSGFKEVTEIIFATSYFLLNLIPSIIFFPLSTFYYLGKDNQLFVDISIVFGIMFWSCIFPVFIFPLL